MKTVKSYWASLVSRWSDTATLPPYHPLRLAVATLYFLLGYRPLSLLIVLAVVLYRAEAGLVAYCVALVYVLVCERIWLGIYYTRYLGLVDARQSLLSETIDSTKASLAILQSRIDSTSTQLTALESETGVYASNTNLPAFLHLRKAVVGRSLH